MILHAESAADKIDRPADAFFAKTLRTAVVTAFEN